MKKIVLALIAGLFFANTQIQSKLNDKEIESIKLALTQMANVFNKYIKMENSKFAAIDEKQIGCELLGTIFKGKGNIFNIGLIFAKDYVDDEEDFEILIGAVGAITPLLNKALFNKLGCAVPKKPKEEIEKEVEQLSKK